MRAPYVTIAGQTAPGDGICIAGETYINETSKEYVTIKYNTSGIQQWVKRYGGTGNSFFAAKSIAVDGLGNIYVTGGSEFIGTNNDYVTIKYKEFMKNLSIIILFLFFCQNSACQLKKVSIDSIEKSLLKRTKSFAFDTYNAQQEKSLPKLSKSIATKRALELYKYKNFSEQISAISETYGSLLKVDFIEDF